MSGESVKWGIEEQSGKSVHAELSEHNKSS